MSFDVPEGWEIVKIGELAEVVTGSTPSKRNSNFLRDGLPFYKPTDLDAGYEVIEAREYLSDIEDKNCRVLPAFSVLVTCIGATIGKTGLARKTCATNQQINSIISNKYFNSKWLFWILNSFQMQSQIIDNSSSTTFAIEKNQSEY